MALHKHGRNRSALWALAVLFLCLGFAYVAAPAVAEETSGERYEPYLGTYVANFGPFRNTAFTVQVKDGNLAVDVPGQMVFVLKDPDPEGKWRFAIDPNIALSFDRDASGAVTGMKMYQAGMTFELPKGEAEPEERLSLHEVQPYLGYYHVEEENLDVEVIFINGRVAIVKPGLPTPLDLLPPDENGLRPLQVQPQVAIRFDEDASGEVVSFTTFHPGGQIVRPRVDTPAADAVPVAPAAAKAVPKPARAEAPLTLQARLDRLVAELESQQKKHHIPGMAIAIVKDDEVILARGFGMANVEEKRPATEETIFAIGSSTKQFTSNLVGMLVDEGKMAWDDPVTKYVPYFTLHVDSDDEKAQATLRDVLSHRTGFTRMGILWKGGEASREEILRTAGGAKPWAPFRKHFFYNNVHYLAAGEAAAKAASSDWDSLIAEKIFQPLGMTSSSTSLDVAQEDPRFSLGYNWDETSESFELQKVRNIDSIAPAGAINSNVLDMARWIRFQLAGGLFDGKRLISEEQLKETWTSQIEIPGGVSYGMGWLIRDWKGQTELEHGGNVEGFAAQVALLPDSNIGFVLLANVTASPLQGIARGLVWEALEGDGLQRSGGVDFTPYLGEYTSTVRNTRLTILDQDGRLALKIEGQGTFELKQPDDEGVWRFAVSDQVGVSFQDDESGVANTLIVHEGQTTAECYREGFVPPPEMDRAELDRYLGNYKSRKGDTVLKLIVQNHRLAIDHTSQGVILELHAPDKGGLWEFRYGDGSWARFQEDPAGRITGLEIVRDGAVQDDLFKQDVAVAAAPAEPLPSLEEIIALRFPPRRRAALKRLDQYRFRGTFDLVHSGVKGKVDFYSGGSDRFLQNIDLGGFGHIRMATNGDEGWSDSSMGEFEKLDGKMLAQIKRAHPSVVWGDWREFFDTIDVVRATEYGGKKVYILKMRSEDLPPWTVWVDAETGDTLREDRASYMPKGIGMIEMTSRYEDFRNIRGLRIPFKHTVSHDAMGTIVTQLSKLETRGPYPDDMFVLKPRCCKKKAAKAAEKTEDSPRAGLQRRRPRAEK